MISNRANRQSPKVDGDVEDSLAEVWGNGPSIPLLRPGLAAMRVLDAFERLLWWLFAGSAGAKTRAQVLKAIRQEPRNAQQLSEALGLDYSTVRHHLKVMQQNHVVVTEGTSYGKLYFLSDVMEAHWANLEGILARMKARGER